MRAGVVLFVALVVVGCTRAHYRRSADEETYGAIEERTGDPRWNVPSVSIDPPPESRLHDPFDPDHPPMPPDDPVAAWYMRCADGHKGDDDWHDDGDAPWIESPGWRQYLALSDGGTLVLTPERSVELGLVHSREYQTQLEDLYFTALTLTLERFEFALHWFGGNATSYEHFGASSVPTETNTLTTASELGFTRAMTTGAELLVDFANSFVWEFTGPVNQSSTQSNIVINLVQPILRGAWKAVRMEGLTQAERSVLYAVRDYARFRKQFYLDITTRGGGFLGLLLQVQNIRNLETNLSSLRQNLLMHEALYDAGKASSIQVDQVFQSYQQGRLSLLRAQTALDNTLDTFKINLGLPPDVSVVLDDAQLAPFQLNDPAVTKLGDELEKFMAEYRELDAAPPLDKLADGFRRLKSYPDRTRKLIEQVAAELARWQVQPKGTDEEAKAQELRERTVRDALAKQLGDLGGELTELVGEIDKAAAVLAEGRRTENWEALQRLTRDQNALVAELFVIQTQIRVFLIQLNPVVYELDRAIQYARENRLDLMNQRAQVVDAWRRITVTADRLESDLNVEFNADIATEPGGDNPVAFSALASRYTVGFEFDGPLNRQVERNIYRTSLINYQRARRAYMALDDSIQQAIRRDVRQLQTDRLNFEIARQSLIAAARQVEQSRDQLLVIGAERGSTTTQDVLNALNSLLQAKNTLIESWVSYETGRLQLLFDLEAFQVDPRGVYTDEHPTPANAPAAIDAAGVAGRPDPPAAS